MPNVKSDQADTYKCFATNEYGKAMVTVVLNVIEGKNCLLAMDMTHNITQIYLIDQAFSQIYFKLSTLGYKFDILLLHILECIYTHSSTYHPAVPLVCCLCDCTNNVSTLFSAFSWF